MSNWNKENPFTLGQVLSIVTTRLMCDMSGVYAILNHMTGQSLFTHQLLLAKDKCEPVLQAAFPSLAAIDLSVVTRENWATVLDDLARTHGNAFEVPTLEGWVYSDPIESAIDMFGKDKVITV
jgi:hypothetical protein